MSAVSVLLQFYKNSFFPDLGIKFQTSVTGTYSTTLKKTFQTKKGGVPVIYLFENLFLSK